VASVYEADTYYPVILGTDDNDDIVTPQEDDETDETDTYVPDITDTDDNDDIVPPHEDDEDDETDTYVPVITDPDNKDNIVHPIPATANGLSFYNIEELPSTTIEIVGPLNTHLFGGLYIVGITGDLVIKHDPLPGGFTINTITEWACGHPHDSIIYIEGQSETPLPAEAGHIFTVTLHDMVNGIIVQTAVITLTFDVQDIHSERFMGFDPFALTTSTDRYGRPVHTFSFSRGVQTISGLRPGLPYLLEVWGGQGGATGGRGGYAAGTWIVPDNITQLFINVGEQPTASRGGGGGTDMRTINANTIAGFNSRVIVAGGGGGNVGGGLGGGGTSASIVPASGLVGPATAGNANRDGHSGVAGTVNAGGQGGNGNTGIGGSGGASGSAGGGGNIGGSGDSGGGGGGGAGFGGGGGGGGHRGVTGGGAGGGGGFNGGNAVSNASANAGSNTGSSFSGGNGNPSPQCGGGGGGASGTPGGTGVETGGFGGGGGAGWNSGGGGGGWFGGGGGGCAARGGGGSSFVAGNLGTMTNAQTIAGNRTGNGQARITALFGTINWIARGPAGTDTTNANIRAFIYNGNQRGAELTNGQIVPSGTYVRFYAYFPDDHIMADADTIFSVYRGGEVTGANFATGPREIKNQDTTTEPLSALMEAGRINNILANNATLTFDFTYEVVSTTTLIISKTVDGFFGSHILDFEFTIFFTDADGNPLPEGTEFPCILAYEDSTLILDNNGAATFRLRHDQSIKIKELSPNWHVRVIEAPHLNYKVYFEDSETGITVEANDTTMIPMAEYRTFRFINKRTAPPPTGLNLGDTGSIQLLFVLAGSIALVAYGTRRIFRTKN